MRRDSLGTKLWNFYCRIIGVRYLFSVLAYPLNELNVQLSEADKQDDQSMLGLQSIEVQFM